MEVIGHMVNIDLLSLGILQQVQNPREEEWGPVICHHHPHHHTHRGPGIWEYLMRGWVHHPKPLTRSGCLWLKVFTGYSGWCSAMELRARDKSLRYVNS